MATHCFSKHVSLQAQNLWRLWSNINSPENPDKSHIKLVDLNGNPLGGSGVMGSSVSVR